MKAWVVSEDCLQKSHHLSRVRPFAHRSQMMASSTKLEDLLQKLQRAMVDLRGECSLALRASSGLGDLEVIVIDRVVVVIGVDAGVIGTDGCGAGVAMLEHGCAVHGE
jgi:hypothetical protein